MSSRFVDEDLDWLKEVKPTKTKGHFIQDPVTGLMEGSEPGPGTGEGGGKEGPKAEIEGGAALHPEAINVGGDEWNKETALRLEKEFAEAAPQLEKIVSDAVSEKAEVEADPEEPDPDNAPYVPEEWGMLSGDQQDEAMSDYKTKTYDDYYQSESDNWYSESAPDDARVKVTEDYNDGKETEWATDIVAQFLNDAEEAGHPVPFTQEQLMAAITLDYTAQGGGSTGDPELEIDETKLGEPIGWQAGQETLPGIEPLKPADLLTSGMRDELFKQLEKGFNKEADDVAGKMDPPEYLADSVAEYQSESWDSMDDKDKFSWVTANTNIVEDAQKEYDDYFGEKKPGGETGVVVVPNKYDPLQQNASAQDYERTRSVARHLSIERAATIMVQRGLYKGDFAIQEAREAAKHLDRELWEGWKGSSHGQEGKLLQAAVHDELGGRLNTRMVDYAKTVKDVPPYVASYDVVKAYVRGKWETTQYMLAKAGVNTVELYRAVNIPDTAPPQVFQNGTGPGWSVATTKTFDNADVAAKYTDAEKGKHPDGHFEVTNPRGEIYRVKSTIRFDDATQARAYAEQYQKDPNNPAQHREEVMTPEVSEGRGVTSSTAYVRLPDIRVERNGAASMTTDRSVANGWGGSTGRVVLRASVPRTAVVSVPAYGQNIQGEHEVVVAGTAWKGWDSFYGQAPPFEKIKIGHQVAA